jgi:2-polyprenyl-3-methyl-5-hydroxy-6-metoxy-1,4-benzoquinol methylase
MKILLKVVLKLHSLLYKLASVLAKRLEKQGIHPKHRIMNYHQFFVENISKNDIVLDIGCGNGALTYDVAKKAKEVVGIDAEEKSIKFANKNYKRENLKFIIGDSIEYKFNRKFDVVILSNVLEHIENRTEFLRKIRNLAPKILIRAPMINRDWLVLYKKEMDLEWRADKTHYIEYTLESFQEELQKANLKIDKFSIQFGEIWSVVK